MQVDHIDTSVDGTPHEVYFFRSWTGYAHPVEPMGAMYLEEALQRDGYFRAWMRGESETRRFVFFEGVDLRTTKTGLTAETIDPSEPLVFFRAIGSEAELTVGPRVTPADMLALDAFLVGPGDGSQPLTHLEQTVGLSYRYEYRPDGSLSRVIIKGLDGKVKELVY